MPTATFYGIFDAIDVQGKHEQPWPPSLEIKEGLGWRTFGIGVNWPPLRNMASNATEWPDIRYGGEGIYLASLDLWLDARVPIQGHGRVFVSHAHADHIERHREVICTPPTARLMEKRLGAALRGGHVLEYDIPTRFDGRSGSYWITLLPAGHIFGSAMALVEVEGQTLLYTGDFKLRPGKSAEVCAPRKADVLILEATYGHPTYQFPEASEVLAGIVRFSRETLDQGETPVLIGYSLGKSQELLHELAEAGLAVALHPQAYEMTRLYEALGQELPPYERFDAEQSHGRVVIFPPGADRSGFAQQLGRVRTAAITGWAVDPSCRYRRQVDAAFPLSDHADFNELLELVSRVQPKKIFTCHGFSRELAATLRERGYEAQALGQASEQLALPLALEVPSPDEPRTATVTRSGWAESSEITKGVASEDRFQAFARTCESVRGVSGKHDKVRLLAGYLSQLPEASLPAVTTWLSGYPFPPHQKRPLQLGGATMRDALCHAGGITRSQFQSIYLKHSDLGETAYEVLLNAPRAGSGSEPLSIQDVQELFEAIYKARGPAVKRKHLSEALCRCTALEAKYLMKVLAGELRIGLREGLLEEGLAQGFDVPSESVHRAVMLTGSLGETACAARRGELDRLGLVPFRPLKFMLAGAEPTAAKIGERFFHASARKKRATDTVWVEDKYDGIRCQLHKVGKEAALYSRDLREVTTTFYEIAQAAAGWSHDIILDGEIVAMRGEVILPFAELQKRLGRETEDLFLQEEIPIRFIAFDLLWCDGETLVERTWSERHKRLEALAFPDALRLAQGEPASSVAAIESAFQQARERGNEGIVVKDRESRYTPGRRGLAWIKLKKAYATLDCVVVGVEYGHGKRRNLLSDYTFAVRDEQNRQLRTIGKAYSGLTDEELARLTDHFLGHTRRRHGRYHEVEPDTVVEIAFDRIQRSKRHSSGLALRFPRIQRLRPDKTVQDIDTLETARKLLSHTHQKA